MKRIFLLLSVLVALSACHDRNKKNESLKFELVDLTINSALVRATTTNESSTWYSMCASEEMFDDSYSDLNDTLIILDDYNLYLGIVEEYTEMGFEISIEDLFTQGSDDIQLNSLWPGTRYVLWGALLDADGNSDFRLQRLDVLPPALPVSEQEYNLELSGDTLIVTPSGDEYYWVVAAPAEMLQKYDYTIESYLAESLFLAETYDDFFGIVKLDLVDQCRKWSSLQAGEAEVLVAVSTISEQGYVTSNPIVTASYTIDYPGREGQSADQIAKQKKYRNIISHKLVITK